jgi:hypothetical protein
MAIEFIGHDNLFFLKKNIHENVNAYKKADNSWLSDKFGYHPLSKFKNEFEIVELDPEGDEVDNVKLLYNAMKNLTDSDATDERLWVGLTHGAYWEFMRDSTEQSLKENQRLRFDESLILNRYFFNTARNAWKRSMYINSLSKLWWTGRMCYDMKNINDPYASLELFRSAFSHKLVNTFSNNFIANPETRFALFDAGLHLQSQGIDIKGDTLVPLMKYLNEIGGSFVLDHFSRVELRDKLIRFAEENIEEIKSR